MLKSETKLLEVEPTKIYWETGTKICNSESLDNFMTANAAALDKLVSQTSKHRNLETFDKCAGSLNETWHLRVWHNTIC